MTTNYASYYQLVLSQAMGLLPAQNVFFFGCNTLPSANLSPAQALINALGNGTFLYQSEAFLTILNNIQSSAVTNEAIAAENWVDPSDQDDTPLAGSGLIAVDSLPPQATWSFRSKRVATVVRRARKRFSGVPETWTSQGEVDVLPVDQVKIEKLAEFLGLTFTGQDSFGQTSTFYPIVIKRQKGISSSGKPVYVVPRDLTYIRANSWNVASWEWNSVVSSQNSRKRKSDYNRV